jgi:hypothetical protein
LSKRWSAEEIRRSGAYHEGAHAVVNVVEGHNVRYVSIETEGTGYLGYVCDNCQPSKYSYSGCRTYPSFYSSDLVSPSRTSCLSTLPKALRGSSSTKVTWRGFL